MNSEFSCHSLLENFSHMQKENLGELDRLLFIVISVYKCYKYHFDTFSFAKSHREGKLRKTKAKISQIVWRKNKEGFIG